MKSNIKHWIVELAGELKPLVSEIENSPATCKDHYDRYMLLISKLGGTDATKRKLISLALIEAGGNINGIGWALALT